MTTLFVDDDEGILAMYQSQCEEAGIDALLAPDANMAIRMIRDGGVTHLVCDGKIPMSYGGFPREENGYQVLDAAIEADIKERWIVSSSAEIQRYACEQGLATRAVAKIDAVKMVKEELL